MKNKKRLLALAMTASMAATMMVGCGSKTAGNGSARDPKQLLTEAQQESPSTIPRLRSSLRWKTSLRLTPKRPAYL